MLLVWLQAANPGSELGRGIKQTSVTSAFFLPNLLRFGPISYLPYDTGVVLQLKQMEVF